MQNSVSMYNLQQSVEKYTKRFKSSTSKYK